MPFTVKFVRFKLLRFLEDLSKPWYYSHCPSLSRFSW